MRILALLALLLAGCEVHHEEWMCIDGLTYKHTNGAWVQVDGHSYIDFVDGPIQCVDPPPAGKDDERG